MLLHESNRGDAACFAFFSNGNECFFLLVIELVHNRGKRAAFLLEYVTKRLIDVGVINDLIRIQIGKCVVENVVNVVVMRKGFSIMLHFCAKVSKKGQLYKFYYRNPIIRYIFLTIAGRSKEAVAKCDHLSSTLYVRMKPVFRRFPFGRTAKWIQ